MDIAHILQCSAKEHNDKPALIFKDEVISFAQLKDNVFKLANGLKSIGVIKSSKIAIYLPNCPAYVYSYLSGFCAGAVIIPLDYALKTDELITCLRHAQVQYFIALPKPDIDLDYIKEQVPSI